MPSFLAVLKRHRPDAFLLTHAVDGFSLALDFPVVADAGDRLWALVREMAEPVVEAGGRFYPAKDAALPGELYRASFTEGQLDRFRELKAGLDPDGPLRSALADVSSATRRAMSGSSSTVVGRGGLVGVCLVRGCGGSSADRAI